MQESAFGNGSMNTSVNTLLVQNKAVIILCKSKNFTPSIDLICNNHYEQDIKKYFLEDQT